MVLPKDPPLDLILSNNVFSFPAQQEQIYIGDFTVIDNKDNIHILELIPREKDNALFSIINGQLIWNNSDLRPGQSTFTIVVKVTDRDGNVFTKEFQITRILPAWKELILPNTFTPDNDGKNDTWGIESLKVYGGIKMNIYERGGLPIFFTEDPNKKWDGTYLGKPMPQGTYYYVIELASTGEQIKGILNLVRK